ncbi:hypothetical protein SAY87_020137 [Trapa incisa]|uniref:[fructose-bisphosphate aldolase]-lysine N-methyltransferase n=1 Tax=Trapa incisa TaxID=236973 RepID=A0AAN7Q3B1_9MYRT|nr:hypothetical protein SAY87_020137 [Trapa incisa]
MTTIFFFFTSPTKTFNPITAKPRHTSPSLRPFSLTPLQSAAQPPSQAVQEFWSWLRAEGLVSDKTSTRPGVVQQGLGLVAQRNIGHKEIVLEVPKRLWINPDAVAASEIGRVCSGLKPWIGVALFLIREKKRGDSKWRVYLDILPETTDSTIYWSEEELKKLQGTQLLRTTLGVKEYVKGEFEKVDREILLPHKQLFPSSITFEDFFWAFGILRSRAFSRLPGQNLVLVPLADLINHSSSITTEDYEIKGGGLFSKELLFSLRSPTSVKAGEQVLIQYDLNKSNADLALDYGFIESNPDRNSYTLTLEISESDPFFENKLDIAELNGLGKTAYFDITLFRPLPPAMLPFLRLVALGGADAFLLESIYRNSIWGNLQLPLSRANEELICRVVRDTCKSALSGYGTTIEEDEELQKIGNLGPRTEIAVGVRWGEKKVLQQIEDVFKDKEAELDELEYYQERKLRELGLVGEQGDIIFWEK